MAAYDLEIYKLKRKRDRAIPGKWIFLIGLNIEADDLAEAVEKSEALLKGKHLKSDHFFWQVSRRCADVNPDDLPF